MIRGWFILKREHHGDVGVSPLRYHCVGALRQPSGPAMVMGLTSTLVAVSTLLCFTERDEIEKARIYVEDSLENLRDLLEDAKRAVSRWPR